MNVNSEPDRLSARRFRAIWISDFHLGTLNCKTGPLLDFLAQHDCDTLYLVGDIIDFCRLQRRWFWPESHSQVIAGILGKTDQGTRTIYIPGNHDKTLRACVGQTIAGVEIHHDFMHTMADGKRLLVMHGDEFHGVIKQERETSFTEIMDIMIAIDAKLKLYCQRAGYNSLSSRIKRTAKTLSTVATHYVDGVKGEAVRRGADGVICGHNHLPQVKQSTDFLYCNDGDWVESCTALVETFDGEIFLTKQGAQGWTYLPVQSAKTPRTSRRRRDRPAFGKLRAGARRIKNAGAKALKRKQS